MTYSLVGIGSAILDIIVGVDEKFIAENNFNKSSAVIVDSEKQAELLEKISQFEKVFASGGSVANTILSYAQAGGSAALLSCFSDDSLGSTYQQECKDNNVDCFGSYYSSVHQGTCICLVTPDGERTMQASLGVCNNFSLDTLEKLPEASKILFEGYLLFNPQGEQMLNRCFSNDVILSLSDLSVVNFKREYLLSVLPKVSLLVSNKQEAFALFSITSLTELEQKLSSLNVSALVTLGEEGALFFDKDKFFYGSSMPTSVVDLTGAGDMFLAIFLYCQKNGFDPEFSLEMAAKYSSKVISQVGARLNGNISF